VEANRPRRRGARAPDRGRAGILAGARRRPRRGLRRGHVLGGILRADDAPASRHEGTALADYAIFGPPSGPLPSSAGYLDINVVQAREIRTPVGEATVAGQDRLGRALWRLTIDTIEVLGLFVVIDREFRPAGCRGG
jgi:hypothetical protein